MSVKKLHNFFCRSAEWVRCGQEEMIEKEAVKYAKDFDLRFEEVSK